MRTQSPPATTKSRVDIYGRGKVLRPVAALALAAALLAAAAVPGIASADSSVTAPKAAAVRDRPELRKAIQDFIDAGFAGMQLRVHDQRGEWAGSAGVGKLGQSAMPPTNGRFWAGSVTKPFTATLVLQLVAEGKIALDAPVAGYLPTLTTRWPCS